MKNEKIRLIRDVETNSNKTFPDVFNAGLTGKKILVADKERGLTLLEIKILNKVYLYTFQNIDFEIVNED